MNIIRSAFEDFCNERNLALDSPQVAQFWVFWDAAWNKSQDLATAMIDSMRIGYAMDLARLTGKDFDMGSMINTPLPKIQGSASLVMRPSTLNTSQLANLTIEQVKPL